MLYSCDYDCSALARWLGNIAYHSQLASCAVRNDGEKAKLRRGTGGVFSLSYHTRPEVEEAWRTSPRWASVEGRTVDRAELETVSDYYEISVVYDTILMQYSKIFKNIMRYAFRYLLGFLVVLVLPIPMI